MRAVILILLLSSCSTQQSVSQWDYMKPEHVKCIPNKEMKFCRQYGVHLICKCISR